MCTNEIPAGVPVTRLKATEKEKLLSMENILSKEIVGQPEAIKAVSNAIRLSRSGLNSQDRPIASFLFCGPSGTGKTQLTKALARFLFDSEDALIRIDGSEYSEKHSVSRLVGAPAGYVGYEEGGQLTEFVRRKVCELRSCYASSDTKVSSPTVSYWSMRSKRPPENSLPCFCKSSMRAG